MPDNTPLTVLGRTPGGEWLMVKTADSRLGWVFREAGREQRARNEHRAAGEAYRASSRVSGHLTDTAGGPVNGVQFAVVQAGVSDEVRTDAMTDADGIFYAFLPARFQGLLVGELHCHLVRKQR